MTGRFLRWLFPWLLALVAAAILIEAWAVYTTGPRQTAGMAPTGLADGRTASDTSTRPLTVPDALLDVFFPLNRLAEEAQPVQPPTALGTGTPGVVGRPSLSPRATAGSCDSPCWVVLPTPDAGHVSRIADVIRTGLASTYGPAFSEWWVALPDGPGWRFRVCGPVACRTLVSTDAGPDLAMQRAGRIVDLPVGAFEAVCGCSWRMGLVPVSVTLLGRK